MLYNFNKLGEDKPFKAVCLINLPAGRDWDLLREGNKTSNALPGGQRGGQPAG
jgi:hypothetical protein